MRKERAPAARGAFCFGIQVRAFRNGAVTGFLSLVTVCTAVTLQPVPHMQME